MCTSNVIVYHNWMSTLLNIHLKNRKIVPGQCTIRQKLYFLFCGSMRWSYYEDYGMVSCSLMSWRGVSLAEIPRETLGIAWINTTP